MHDKASLGTRYTCYECEKKFYDLNRPEPACPGCGADQREDPTPDPRVAVMARYKGTRLTTDQTMPSKEQFKVEDDATEKGGKDAEGAGDAKEEDAKDAKEAKEAKEAKSKKGAKSKKSAKEDAAPEA